MQWIGKAVGGVLGYAAAGPFRLVGLALGIMLGHQFDKGLSSRSATRRRAGFGSEKNPTAVLRDHLHVDGAHR